MNQSVRRPKRLCWVGPYLSNTPGWAVNQAEILADLFRQSGIEVRLTSRYPHRILRLFDTLFSINRWKKWIEIAFVDVFSGWSFGIADLSSWLLKKHKIPAVFVLRGGNLPQFIQRYPAWTDRVFRRANAFIAPSKFLATPNIRAKKMVSVIPNVLELSCYPYRFREQVQPTLLWMRTFHEIYNPQMAVTTLAEVIKVFPKATLTMAGQDKGLLAETRAYARQLGVEHQIRFPGFLDLAGKQTSFASHDIFLNTNRVDNMPVSVLEAAAFGLPVVATQVGGIPYLLGDEQTGLLVEDDQPLQMARAVQRLVESPWLAARLSENGRNLAEKSAWGHVKPLWEQVFRDVLDA